MIRKKETTVVKKSVRTLLEQYQELERDFPEKFRQLEKERRESQNKLLGTMNDDDPRVDELHKMAEKIYVENQDKTTAGPPLLHVCFQYAKAVTQSRYEASKFSNIAHHADSIVDFVTSQEDDSDNETLVDVKGGGSLLQGLGLSEQKAAAELRILVLRLLNANKMCDGEIQSGRVAVSYQDENKSFREKTRRRSPDYRHRIGFSHVFSFRGLPIEEYGNAEIQINVKVNTEDENETAYAVLSANGCTFGEADADLHPYIVTDTDFWKRFLEDPTEMIVERTIPLVRKQPRKNKSSPGKFNAEKEQHLEHPTPAHEKSTHSPKLSPEKKKEKKKSAFKKLFS